MGGSNYELIFGSFCLSENGWTSGQAARQWIEDDFDAATQEKAQGHTRVLVMDGHSSHYTPELLHYCKDNNIIVLRYPLHCTHILQGLDVVCFAKMKNKFHVEIEEHEHLYFQKVDKKDFAGVFGHALETSRTSSETNLQKKGKPKAKGLS